jgi:hypothetical protein
MTSKATAEIERLLTLLEEEESDGKDALLRLISVIRPFVADQGDGGLLEVLYTTLQCMRYTRFVKALHAAAPTLGCPVITTAHQVDNR